MGIDDLDVGRTGRPTRPLEADSPLIVNPNTVLSTSVALQCLKPVSRQCAKVLELDSRFQTIEFKSSGAFKSAEPSDPLA